MATFKKTGGTYSLKGMNEKEAQLIKDLLFTAKTHPQILKATESNEEIETIKTLFKTLHNEE